MAEGAVRWSLTQTILWMPEKAAVHAQASSLCLRFQTSTLLANPSREKKKTQGASTCSLPKPHLGCRDEELWLCPSVSHPAISILPNLAFQTNLHMQSSAWRQQDCPAALVSKISYNNGHIRSAASLGTVTNLCIHLHKLYKNECIKLYLSVLVSSLIWVDVACPPTVKTYNIVGL